MSSGNLLCSILGTNKLNGSNYEDWLRNLRIVFMSEKIAYVLENNIPLEPPADASDAEKQAYKKWLDDSPLAKCYMLASMTNELQRQHEKLEA